MALDVEEIKGSKALLAGRLCNFKTGSPKPLATHMTWLDSKVKQMVAKTPNAWIDIIGHASRQWNHTGGQSSHQLNRALSLQRCKQVEAKIALFGSKATFNLELAEGDSRSVGPKPDDGFDRAVEVYVYAAAPGPKPQPPKPIESLQFEIRVVGGGSASYVIGQADEYFFQIVDITRKQTAFYLYAGAGVTLSHPKIPGPGSMTKTGPPSPFTTTRDTQLYMFNSKASLKQDGGATLGSWSVGGTMRLTIYEIFDAQGAIHTQPTAIPITSGFGIQMPTLGSETGGVLSLVAGPWPFTGY